MLCVLVTGTAVAPAEDWVSVGPFAGQTATAVAGESFLGGTFRYAAIEGVGVFRSPDLGATWSAAGAGLTDTRVSALVLHHVAPPSPTGCPPPCYGPGVVFASTHGGGVFVLRGDAWRSENSGLTDLDVTALAADSTGVWAGTGGGGLFRTTFSASGPQTWLQVVAPSDGTSILSIAVAPGDSTVYFGTFVRVYRSRNGGASWSRLQDGSLFHLGDVRAIAVDPERPGTVYAAGIQSCDNCGAPSFPVILKSSDGGDRWTDVSFGIANPLANALLLTDFGNVFAGTASGVARSVDGGLSWTSVGLDGIHVAALTEAPFPFSEAVPLIAGTAGSGVYRAELRIAGCQSNGTMLCLRGGRFSVRVSWSTVREARGSGAGQSMPLTVDTGAFWFFQPSNIELVVKVLDGRAINGHFWVFFGALSDVAYTITVTDTETGVEKTYTNPQGTLASRADTEAF